MLSPFGETTTPGTLQGTAQPYFLLALLVAADLPVRLPWLSDREPASLMDFIYQFVDSGVQSERSQDYPEHGEFKRQGRFIPSPAKPVFPK